MLNISSKNSDGCGIDTKTRPIKFLANLFKRKKGSGEDHFSEMDRASQSGMLRKKKVLSCLTKIRKFYIIL